MNDSTQAVLDSLDRLHREDPAGRELAYAEAMTRWLRALDPAPDPLLEIAVRAQHLKRWERPRDAFPAGRKGYLQWRRQAAQHHARLVGDVLREHGYGADAIERVVSLVEKRNLARDPMVQTLEDCACLAFLETGLAEFRGKHPADKVDEILEKTRRKMSPAAQALAAPLLEK